MDGLLPRACQSNCSDVSCGALAGDLDSLSLALEEAETARVDVPVKRRAAAQLRDLRRKLSRVQKKLRTGREPRRASSSPRRSSHSRSASPSPQASLILSRSTVHTTRLHILGKRCLAFRSVQLGDCCGPYSRATPCRARNRRSTLRPGAQASCTGVLSRWGGLGRRMPTPPYRMGSGTRCRPGRQRHRRGSRQLQAASCPAHFLCSRPLASRCPGR